MKLQKILLYMYLALFAFSLEASNFPDKLSESYTAECTQYYQEIIAKDAYDDLVSLRIKTIPVINAAEKLRDYEVLAYLYPKLLYVYSKEANLSEIIKISKLYLDLPSNFIVEEQKIKEWGRLSELYSQIGIQGEAYRYHLKAVGAVERSSNLDLKFRILFQSGTVFYYQKKYDEAIDFYTQALELAKNTPELKKYIDSTTSALTSIAIKNGKLELAKKYCQQQLNKAVLPYIEAHVHQYLGDIFKLQHELDSAQFYYQKSLALFQSLSSSLKESELLNELGNLALVKNDYWLAEELFLQVLSAAESPKKEDRAAAFNGLSKSYEGLGRYKKAFQYQKAYNKIQPELFSDSTSLKLDKLKAEFLLEKQQEDLNRKEEAIQQLEWQNIAYGTGAFSVLIILFIVVWNFVAQRKAHLLAIKQKQRIEHKNTQLKDYNERLERFNSVVSHDLKQPLRTSLSMLGLFKRRYADTLNSDAREYLDLSDQALKQMFKLVEGLLNLTQLKKAADKDKEWVNSFSLISTAKAQLQTLIEEKEVEIKMKPELEKWPIIRVHEGPMIQLWQNLLSNAIKFTPADRTPKIKVAVVEKRNGYIFEISDNGIGIAEEFKTKIFEMFKRLNARGDYDGNGIGLATCKQVVELHSGNIWVKPYEKGEENQGTTFRFSIPKENKTIPFQEQLLLQAV